jgi:hypothetical protein
MQHLEVSGAVRHIYAVMWQRVNATKLQNYDYARCFVLALNLVTDIEGGT